MSSSPKIKVPRKLSRAVDKIGKATLDVATLGSTYYARKQQDLAEAQAAEATAAAKAEADMLAKAEAEAEAERIRAEKEAEAKASADEQEAFALTKTEDERRARMAKGRRGLLSGTAKGAKLAKSTLGG